jgi:TP901 family phage tail tape measure protein
MSNNVDGSISLGIVLEDSNVDEQARKIGEKIQKQLEKALQNSDFFKAIPTPKFEKGAGSREGKVYGDEFLNSFGKVLQSGNVQLAKSYQGTFNRILATEGETAARSFISNFEKILTTQGDKAASTFSNGLQAALKAGGSVSAKQFADNFQKQFSAVAPNVFKDFNKAFNDVLNKSNPGTAKLFATVYQEANKSSTKAGEAFLQNFQKILTSNGSKAANEFAKGYQVAFKNQGEISANFYAESFKRRLEREKFEVKATVKTVPIGDFNNVLNSSNASTAKGFASTFKDIAGTSEKAANEFSRAFKSVLKGTSPQIANEFAKGFQIAFKEGGSSSASTYAQSFKQRLENELKQQQFSTKTVIQPSPGVSNTAFGKVLGNSDVGTAKLFASTFKEVNQVSTSSAEAFSKNFQRILNANGPKTAKEFAAGFQASFKQGGTESAASFAQSFNNRLIAKSREAAREAAAAIKGEISAPEIPQSFVNTFSKILRKYGPSVAKDFSSTWSKVYETVGLDAANLFQKKFQDVLKRGGAKRANEYTKGLTLAYSVAGEEAAKEFSKKFKNRAGIDFKGIGSFMRDTLVSTLGNGLSGAVLGIFNGIFSVIKGGFDNLISGFTGSIGRFMTVQKGLTNLKAVTGASDSEMGSIKSAIRSSSLKSPTSTDDYTKISLELSKAGTPIDQINEKLLTSISLMSRLSGEGATETAGMVSQIQSSFSLPLEDMVSTMDLMTAVANGSQASIGSLANALSYTGATATSLGLDLQQTARYLGILANNGLDASRGGTALTNMMADMSKNAELLKDLGIEIFDAKGAQNFEIALGSLQEKLKDLSAKDKYKLLSEIFGERGIRGVQALLTGLEEGDQKTAQLDKAIQAMNGSLAEAGGKLTDPASKLDLLKNKIDVLRTEFGAAFEPGLNALIEFGDQTATYLLENSNLFDLLNQANQEFADYLAEHPEYAQMLAEIMQELAVEVFQELLNGARSLLEYLKENPKAVQELFQGFKNFASAVIDILPKVGKLVELLFNGAKFLGLINDGTNNTQSDPSGKEYFASGLFTGPESNNGGSSAYHIDTKFAKDLPFDRVIAAMDSMAFAYEEQGRVIEFSNSAVGGMRYDPNDPNRGDMIKKAFGAHSHSVHQDWNSLDYYIPKKDKDRFASGSDGGEGVEIMLPAFQGGKTEYGTGGGYGNYAVIVDENGKDIIKTGHGDDRKPLPSTRTFDSTTSNSSEPDNFGLMTGKKSSSTQSRGISIKDESGNVSYATSGKSPLSQLTVPGGERLKNSKNSGGSKAAPKPTIQNASPDQLAGAVMAIFEAPTRQGRIDAAQVISNRVGSNFDGFGRTIKDQVFAGDMRNPQFAPMRDFNIGKNDITDFPSAVRTLMKKPGYSESLAKKELAEFFSDLSNPRMTQDSQNKVGGRHYFKGVSEQGNMVRGEDFLRNPNENFYHHENSDTTHRSVTPIGNVFGGGLSSNRSGSKSKMPQYESLNLMGDNPVDEFLNLSSGGSKLEKMREDKNKAIQKLLDEQEKIEKKQAAEERKNDEESLKVKRAIYK